MDSPTVILENSSGFLSVPPRLELFLHMILLQQYQILSLETLQLFYSSILMAFFSKKGPTVEYAQLYKNKRRVPLGVPKICFGGFSSGIKQNIQKTRKLVNVRMC